MTLKKVITPEEIYEYANENLGESFNQIARKFGIAASTVGRAVRKLDRKFVDRKERFLQLKSFVICAYKKENPLTTIDDFMVVFPYPKEFIELALRLQGLKAHKPKQPRQPKKTVTKPTKPERIGVNLSNPDTVWAAAGVNFSNGVYNDS